MYIFNSIAILHSLVSTSKRIIPFDYIQLKKNTEETNTKEIKSYNYL